MSKGIIVKCPMCKTSVKRCNEYFPFCSPRCQTTDLGNWASDTYSIPDRSDAQPYDDDEGQPVIH
ncbi:MAG TPA: DNA gyrase inhibitor YacG [Ghiorsea sp.]|nr:DNA gyrase inhibitor YacG [Ghiorsea sp.]HIP07517.1 DNA gyrase inhibitor YacG [Mariprofundaceae bacterium]